MKFYYELTENGYWIKDEDDELFKIHQYEPYIPDKSLSYEENAKKQMAEIATGRYAGMVQSGEVGIEEVPEEYRETVEQMVEEAKASQTYTLDEAAALIAQEVSA